MSEDDPIRQVIQYAADLYGVDADDITSLREVRKATRARDLAAWVLVRALGCSFSKAGKILGDRSYTTISRAIRRLEEVAEKDSELAARMYELHHHAKSLIGKDWRTQ